MDTLGEPGAEPCCCDVSRVAVELIET